MGYSRTGNITWGDDPQDVVDSAINSRMHDKRWSSKRIPKEKRVLVAKSLIKDRDLRVRVNKEYKRDLGRIASDAEYRNLIKVGLNLGGYTISWR